MKTYVPPPSWDPAKLAARYQLDMQRDFYVDAAGMLVIIPDIPDDPPIFDLPDVEPLEKADPYYFVVKTRTDRPGPGDYRNGTMCWIKDERTMFIVIQHGWVKMLEVT